MEHPPVGPHILVSDDDADAANFFARFLKRSGYRVTEVHDGIAAMEHIQRGHIDAVLSDIGMPGLNGIELVKALAAKGDTTPVVLITGNPLLVVDAETVRGLTVDILHKPVAPSLILAVIEKAVGASKASARKP